MIDAGTWPIIEPPDTCESSDASFLTDTISKRLPSLHPVHPLDPAELARISAALVKAMAEARVMHDANGIDENFRENLRHARELHDLLLEGLIEAEPAPPEYLRGLCDSMGNNLDELEKILARTLS